MQRAEPGFVMHRAVRRARRLLRAFTIQPDRRVQLRVRRFHVAPAGIEQLHRGRVAVAHGVRRLDQREIRQIGHGIHSFASCNAASKLDGSSSNTSVPRSASKARMVAISSAAIRRAGSFGADMPCHRAIVASTSAAKSSMFGLPGVMPAVCQRGGSSDMPENDGVFETNVPARLDRLPWSRFHWLVIVALGIAWVLDGLEVTIVGSLAGALTESPVLHLTGAQVGLAASAYLIGAVAGALFFGWLTDRLGRKKLFSITVLVYLTATVACGLSWDFWSFALFRLLTGAGIGGEYAAVNATIQELIPARRRGFTDLVVNGSFWLGAAAGAIGALVVLNPAVMPAEYGWRFAFIIGGVLGLIVLLLRRFLPESPRWLMTHGQPEEAVRVVTEIEQRVERDTGRPLPPVPHQALRLRRDVQEWFGPAARALFTDYRRRAVLGITLMAAQAFCYNAVFFTYALILKQFYGVASGDIGWF